jgi:transposase-like protein
LQQIVDLFGLRVHRSTLHRWLRRARPAASATPAAPGAVESAEAAAEDAAALAVLDDSGFVPPSPTRRP